MKKKTYRLCLLSLVILAVIGGIFYYKSHSDEMAQEVDGTFVERPFTDEEMEWLAEYQAEKGWDSNEL